MKENGKGFDPQYILGGWERLHDNLHSLTESQCEKLLEVETAGENRPNYIKRIHARFTKLRSQREREKLLKKSGVK